MVEAIITALSRIRWLLGMGTRRSNTSTAINTTPTTGHTHDGPVSEPHSHWHRHAPLSQSDPHYPDLHHRHRHG